MHLSGTYGGIVENVRDPERLGRVKVRVPHVHGVGTDGAGYIGVNDLPWAMPSGMPAGGSAASGGFSHLPAIGDHVWVRFLDGEPEKPLWEWGMQTFSDRDKLKLHDYDMLPTGEVGLPKSTAWTRFNHRVEMAATGINNVTSNGYRIQIIDGVASGRIELATSLGNLFRMDDEDNGATLMLNQDWFVQVTEAVSGFSNAFEWVTATQDFSVESGANVNLTAALNCSVGAGVQLDLDALATMNLTSPAVRLGSSSAVEPVVLGTQLTLFLESLLAYLSTHTHGNGNMGSPTSPPLQPAALLIQPFPPLLVSKTVFTV